MCVIFSIEFHRTNKFLLPLLLVVAVNNEGKAFVAASALISSEDEENFSWVLSNLKKFTQTQGPTILTDGFFKNDFLFEYIHSFSIFFEYLDQINKSMYKVIWHWNVQLQIHIHKRIMSCVCGTSCKT